MSLITIKNLHEITGNDNDITILTIQAEIAYTMSLTFEINEKDTVIYSISEDFTNQAIDREVLLIQNIYDEKEKYIHLKETETNYRDLEFGKKRRKW